MEAVVGVLDFLMEKKGLASFIKKNVDVEV